MITIQRSFFVKLSKYCVNFQSNQDSFFVLFLVHMKWLIVNIVQTTISLQNISIGAIMKNPEILRSVPDHLKTKKMCKHAVRKLSFLTRYVPDRYKTHQMVLCSQLCSCIRTYP